MLNGRIPSSDPRIVAQESIFGWVIGGGSDHPSFSYRLTTSDSKLDGLLQKFWEREEIAGDNMIYTQEEHQALEHFKDHTSQDNNGRYVVKLPRKEPLPELGESRPLALKQFLQNEKLLERKGQWECFSSAVQEYGELGHAEPVPPKDLLRLPHSSLYLPMHGVVKASSTTIKLRVVFDASAKSSSGYSLNDQLLPGPNLYPLLSSVINKFRTHRIGMTADI